MLYGRIFHEKEKPRLYHRAPSSGYGFYCFVDRLCLFLRNLWGFRRIPGRLGSLNAETGYLLERFGFDAPLLLQDARMKLSEIEMDSPVSITPDTTIYETLQIMQQHNRCLLWRW